MWLDDMEDEALRQAKNLANLPFVFRHVAIMPDSHSGYGMPIGGVLATKGVIIPNAVGVDIGCGMCAVKTNIKSMETRFLKEIMGSIRNKVPVGFNKHKQPQDEANMPVAEGVEGRDNIDGNKYPVIKNEYVNALKSVGSLGGGNHFIEIQKASDGFIWIMIHSGSRNIGLKVANHYNKAAQNLNEKWHAEVPKSWELAFLPIESNEGKNYLREMRYCVEFAFANRRFIMERIKESFIEVLPNYIEFDEMINIAHNYAAFENHFGENVIVHRKGATRADEGLTGIIPGSQGTKSYIVSGKGNADSFRSCSHGAGRKMSRKKAINSLDIEREKSMLERQGIIHAIRNIKDLDEAPSAYKDIDEVMANQSDLVDILVELTPLAVVKG